MTEEVIKELRSLWYKVKSLEDKADTSDNEEDELKFDIAKSELELRVKKLCNKSFNSLTSEELSYITSN